MTSSVQPVASTVATSPAAAAAARPGWRTSEFWLSVAAIAGTVFAPIVDNMTSGATDRLAGRGIAGAIAAGAIVGAYTLARGMVKAAAAKGSAVTLYDGAGAPLAVGASSSSSAAAPAAGARPQ